MERSTETKASAAESVSASCSTVRVSESGDWQAALEENISAVGVVSFSAFNPWRWYLAFRRAKVITIEPVVFLYMLAVFLNSSLTSQYYVWRFGKQALLNTTFPSEQNLSVCINSSELDLYGGNITAYSVQTSSRRLLIFTGLAYNLPSIFTALLLGPCSDRYGRRFIIYLVTAGAILQGLMSIAVIHFELNIYFFILISAVSGIAGGYASILTATMAYIADISSPRWRTFRIGLAQSMVFFSGAVAQGIFGYWLAELNCSYAPPLWLFTACNAVVILYTLIFLPESLTDKERKRISGCTSCFTNLARGLRIYFCGLKYSTWRLWAALLAMSTVVANMAGSQALSTLFFQASPLSWNPGEVGTYQAVNMAAHGVVLVLLLSLLVGIKFPDALIAIVGLIFSAGTNIFMGFVSQSWEMFVGMFQNARTLLMCSQPVSSSQCLFFYSLCTFVSGVGNCSQCQRDVVKTSSCTTGSRLVRELSTCTFECMRYIAHLSVTPV